MLDISLVDKLKLVLREVQGWVSDGRLLFDNIYVHCGPECCISLLRARALIFGNFAFNSIDYANGQACKCYDNGWRQGASGSATVSKTEGIDPEKHAIRFLAGQFQQQQLANGIIFAHHAAAEVADYQAALDLDGFLVTQALRTTGMDKALTSFGLERGRLLHMFEVGADTSALTLLLIHGASFFSVDGAEAVMLRERVKGTTGHLCAASSASLQPVAKQRYP